MRRCFAWICRHPVVGLAAVLAPTLLAGFFIPQLVKDTRNEAFMPHDHPAVSYKERVEEIFGLSDRIVVAVVNDGPNGVFNPGTLALVHWLSGEISNAPGVDRVTSLVTEKSIRGTETELIVEPFLEEPPTRQIEADAVRSEVMRMDLYRASLVSIDGTTTVVIGDIPDAEQHGNETYLYARSLIERAPVTTERIYVAGEGAASAYLGTYIDRDAQRLNPLAALVIVAILFLAYRTALGVLLPMVVVGGSLAVSLGTMAALGIPFYVTTSALTVILIGIGVCDGIHILGHYYQLLGERAGRPHDETIIETMMGMWRPVMVTSLTSMAGFLALSFASISPPMRAFGNFAALGTFAAMMLSLVAIPAGLVLVRPRPSPSFRHSGHEFFGRAVSKLGRAVVAAPGTTLFLSVLVMLGGILGASRLTLDDERIRYFDAQEPIRKAMKIINDRLSGTNHLDVVIEAAEPDALVEPENLRTIERLQERVGGLARVAKTISVVDVIKQMNRAMNEDREDEYRIPDSRQLIAQYFLLYSASGDPTDFEELVDPAFRVANLRLTIDRGRWSDFIHVVEGAEPYLDEASASGELTVKFGGNAYVSYHRAKELLGSHPLGVGLAFLAVWLMTSFAFRSRLAGAIALVPVALPVLMIYAIMGYLDIWLGSGTAMTAAIAVGLSVDFSVHTLDRMRNLTRNGVPLDRSLEILFASTGRALLFNLMAIVLGFGALTISQVPSLRHFGLLVVVCVCASFIGSQSVLPALVMRFRPRFLWSEASHPAHAGQLADAPEQKRGGVGPNLDGSTASPV